MQLLNVLNCNHELEITRKLNFRDLCNLHKWNFLEMFKRLAYLKG